MKRTILALLSIIFVTQASVYAQPSQPRRVALVVGNGAYGANELRNPPNDATDVAAALKDAGFEVTLLKDADLTAFDKAVSAFAAKLKGADTGLFYYAGHGVAVDGLNYIMLSRLAQGLLFPVSRIFGMSLSRLAHNSGEPILEEGYGQGTQLFL